MSRQVSFLTHLFVACSTVPFSDITVFVDPLDGSREFVEGRVSNCQCLIGVSLGSTPIAGVMNAPFFHLAYALRSSPPIITNPSAIPFNGNERTITTNLTNMRVGMSGDTGNDALMEVRDLSSKVIFGGGPRRVG